MVAYSELQNTEKAALLLVQMGPERSAKVLMNMRDDEVEELMSQVAHFDEFTPEMVDQCFSEFQETMSKYSIHGKGGLEFAREVLATSFGDQRADEILERLRMSSLNAPFEFLRKADARQVISYLQEEHPQLVALVLAHLPSIQGANILAALPERMQSNIAHRIATLERTSPDVITKVENVLKAKLSSVLTSADVTSVGGVNRVVDILNRSERGTERIVFEGLDQNDPELAEELRSRMFIFDNIADLDNRAIQMILKNIETKDLGTALKGTKDATKNKILKNLSQRAAQNLQEEMELMGPVRIKTVEESQAIIIRVVRKLEDEGQIVVSRGGEDFVT